MNQYILNNGVLECLFTGRMDTVASQAADAELKLKLNADIKEVIFDLADVDYLSSSFLRICISTLRFASKERFRIINVTPTILKVFEIANLTEMLRIC